MKYYAAYGSNLDLAKMASRCPSAHAIAAGMLEDYQLEFHGSKNAYLTICPRNGQHVPLGIFSVEETDERNLDVYEDFPALYYKKQISCTATDLESHMAQTYNAFIYVMRDEQPVALPSNAYLDTVLQGYRDFDFDANIIMEALHKARQEKK